MTHPDTTETICAGGGLRHSWGGPSRTILECLWCGEKKPRRRSPMPDNEPATETESKVWCPDCKTEHGADDWPHITGSMLEALREPATPPEVFTSLGAHPPTKNSSAPLNPPEQNEGGLLPCPFCGHAHVQMRTENIAGYGWASCDGCGCLGPMVTVGVNWAVDAVDAWNKRAG